MIRANDEYWDSDRASYEDELAAWRDRTAVPVAVAVVAPVTRFEPRKSGRRPVAVAATRDRRPPRSRARSAKGLGTRRIAIHA